MRIKASLENLKISTNQITLQTASPPPWQLPTIVVNYNLSKFSKSNTCSPAYLKEYYLQINRYSEFKLFFTDVSKTSTGVGCSFVCGSEKVGIRLPEFCSVYTAELYAILSSLVIALTIQFPRFLVLSDSLSALQAIESLNL